MQLQSLRHLLSVIQAVAAPHKIYLLDSGCLLPEHPELGEPGQPLALTQDGDFLIEPVNDALAGMLQEAVGKEAIFMEHFGYYADILRPIIAETLPAGWEGRLHPVSGYDNVFALDAYDLALVKLMVGRQKDLDLLRALLKLGILEPTRLRAHYQQTPLGEREAVTAGRNLQLLLSEPGPPMTRFRNPRSPIAMRQSEIRNQKSQMKHLHILTVGISLLTNFAKANNLPLERVLRLHKQLAAFLKADPRAACSEINSLDAYTGLLRKKNKGLAVTLVYSATAGKESQLAARLIGNFLKHRGLEVAEIKLKDIGVPANPQADPAEAARLAEAGLMRLYDKLESHITKLRQLHPNLGITLNATGGYKAETAILYGLGCELGLPVYYLHETYRVPITLPVCAVPF